MRLKIYKHIISYKILLHLEKNDEKHKQTLIKVIWMCPKKNECFSSFSLCLLSFCKVYFLQKYNKYIYRQKKNVIFLKETGSVLNDFETCHSAGHLRPAAFLPSLLELMVRGRKPYHITSTEFHSHRIIT